ncbi:MAG: GNAT family N-acetyltransferase [Actinomycetales bacterium]
MTGADGWQQTLADGSVVQLVARALTEAEAQEVRTWRYPPPFDLYDWGGEEDDSLEVYLRHEAEGWGYYPVVEQQEDGVSLIGFVCFGAEARVRGQRVREEAVDVGAGVAPERVSRGVMTAMLPLALALAADQWPSAQVARAAVAAFNERSLRLCERAGFVQTGVVTGAEGRAFVELERPLR